MSKRASETEMGEGTVTGMGKAAATATRREYAAAEERLLDYFSPLEETTNSSPLGFAAAEIMQQQLQQEQQRQQQQQQMEQSVDPSRDNMLPFISDDSDIHSLLTSSEGSVFIGFANTEVDGTGGDDNDLGPAGEQGLIFGVSRHPEKDNFMGCTTPKCEGTPLALLGTGYMLSNSSDMHLEQEHLDEQLEQEHLEEQLDHEQHRDAVIYDENVVLLSDEHCCEIIVQSEQEIEHAYLLGLQQQQEQDLNNGVSYGSDLVPAEEEEELEHERQQQTHVYLSDAAMVPDATEEEIRHERNSFVNERPDICEVYDHELEEHDDEQLQLQASILETQPLPPAAVPRSSTTEFPVSSTSMPNGSDYDDYDDELGTAEEQSPPPAQRKYMSLLKNTLTAEHMDRRLALICQSEPQMSLREKLDNWNCDRNCDAVEDVENFETVFAEHEAEPAQQPKFNEFYDLLRQSLSDITKNMRQRSAAGGLSSNDAQDTPYSSEDAALQKRPNYRRLLHVLPAEQSEPIVLDDDDDDDCIEVQATPSLKTLVPEASNNIAPLEPGVKTIETQTTLPATLETKETSTTDLNKCLTPSSPEVSQYGQLTEDQSHQVEQRIRQQIEEQGNQHKGKLEEQYQQSMRANSLDYHKDAQFYEQHEFCNYLGLTELATANAVATAMRELANSNVARRSLRVRTQQQMDRMRSDVRGKRRERQHQQHLQQEQQNVQHQNHQAGHHELQQAEQQLVHPLDSDTSSNSISGTHESLMPMANDVAMPNTNTESFVYQFPEGLSTVANQTIEYYYHTQVEEQEHVQESLQSPGIALMPASDSYNFALEAAFAQVYAAAAPAQNELHQRMQHRLRQARESKPSIYIVKSLNNAAQPTMTSPRDHNNKNRKTPEPTLPPPPEPAKAARSSLKKASGKLVKRRRTTAAAVQGNTVVERELITRSMNSKMLRNRKVNMLKSYELADAIAQARSKQRLAGGTTGGTAGKRPHKKSQKKSEPSVKPVEPIKQYRLEEQQQQGTAKQKVPYKLAKRKFLRAKSLPAELATEPTRIPAGDADTSVQNPKPVADTHEFIKGQGVISPPLYSAAVRHYVNAVCKPRELQPPEQLIQENQQQQWQHQPLQLQQNAEHIGGFNDLSSTYAQLCKTDLSNPPFSPPASQTTPHFSRRIRQVAGSTFLAEENKMPNIPMTQPGNIMSLTQGCTTLRNPLAGKNGKVLYMYYELDQLIVLQERVISFWKYSKIFSVLQKPNPDADASKPSTAMTHTLNFLDNIPNTKTNKSLRKSTDSDKSDGSTDQRWVYLGGTRRITNDIEIPMPYGNRLCTHNSTPVYIEMRSHPLDNHRRESQLLSLYVNVYYFCEEELRPKMHSVHLDAVNCESKQVIYTSISESRYFVMAWQQETIIGKPRAGICKYSLTPTLDTLASIREFKQLRHELKHIECLTEDRLIGYGQTSITIWDHRSGDTLMNYDLGFDLGRNLGVMHFPSFDMEQSSLLILYQHIKESNKMPELRIFACELSHATPSHRLLHVHRLPSPQFDCPLGAINTGDHLILKSETDDEIWINTADPRQLIYMAPQGTQRFYTRQKSQVIIVTPDTLNVDSIANHVLKLATQKQEMMMTAAVEAATTSG